jgi:hypothetical protein
MCLLAAGLLTVACVGPTGIIVVNRTDVPLAIGFSDPVPPCSDRFLSRSEMNDVTRDAAEGAWTPSFVLNSTENPDRLWLVVSSDGTEIHLDPPSVGPQCGGTPLDWHQ